MSKQSRKTKETAISRILIVDDHPIWRHGMSKLINSSPDLMVCGEASDAKDALRKIALVKPNLVLVDISLKGMNGIELIKRIKARRKSLPILVISVHEEFVYAERAMRAGAQGYVTKRQASTAMIQSIRRVLEGGTAANEKDESEMLLNLTGKKKDFHSGSMEILTDRELEVFSLIGQGYSTRKIAERLHLSVKTIEAYREHIKRKLKLKNGTELIHRAIQSFDSEQ